MQYRNLGSSGLKVSTISLGSWLTFGQSVDQKGTKEVVRAALDVGINLFDTADIYAHGDAEVALGQALGSELRSHVVIATKIYWPMSDSPNDKGLSRKHLFESCHASLQRLGTDYIDLYQCHRFDEDTPVSETVRAMGDLIQQGKILYWGTSMWSPSQLREACMIADQINVPRPISEQPRYSLLHREMERDILNTCDKLGMGLIVWSPLAQGFLTGKYLRGQAPAKGTRGADPESGQWLQEELNDDSAYDLIERAEEAAASYRMPLPRLALAWCLRHRNVASAIVGATRAAQVAQNATAAEVDWTVEMENAVQTALAGIPARS